MIEARPPQGICERVVWDGLPGSAAYSPKCYWTVTCAQRGCFWRKFHQLGQKDAAANPGGAQSVPSGTPEQRGLDL